MHRINYNSSSGRFALDNASASAVNDLARLGAIEIERKENVDVLARRFLNGCKMEIFRTS